MLATTAVQAQTELVVVSWGGAYMAANSEILNDNSASEGLLKLRAMAEANNVTWDLVDMIASDAITACDEGVVLEIDYDNALAAAPDGTSATEDFGNMIVSDCFIPSGQQSDDHGFRERLTERCAEALYDEALYDPKLPDKQRFCSRIAASLLEPDLCRQVAKVGEQRALEEITEALVASDRADHITAIVTRALLESFRRLIFEMCQSDQSDRELIGGMKTCDRENVASRKCSTRKESAERLEMESNDWIYIWFLAMLLDLRTPIDELCEEYPGECPRVFNIKTALGHIDIDYSWLLPRDGGGMSAERTRTVLTPPPVGLQSLNIFRGFEAAPGTAPQILGYSYSNAATPLPVTGLGFPR